MTLNENRTAGCREVLLVCVGGKVSASAQNTNSPHEASSNIFIFLGRGRDSESFSQLWPDKSDPPSHTATSHAHLQAPTNTTTNIVRLRDACQLRPLKSHVGPAARESRPGDHGDTRSHSHSPQPRSRSREGTQSGAEFSTRAPLLAQRCTKMRRALAQIDYAQLAAAT